MVCYRHFHGTGTILYHLTADEIEFTELWRLLNHLNLQLSELYVYLLFKDITSQKKGESVSLNEQGICDML